MSWKAVVVTDATRKPGPLVALASWAAQVSAPGLPGVTPATIGGRVPGFATGRARDCEAFAVVEAARAASRLHPGADGVVVRTDCLEVVRAFEAGDEAPDWFGPFRRALSTSVIPVDVRKASRSETQPAHDTCTRIRLYLEDFVTKGRARRAKRVTNAEVQS